MKKNKPGIITTIIITVALLAILSIISWAIPIPKQDVAAFVVTYVCAMVLIAAEGVLIILGLFKETDGNKKVLGLPILYFGLVAVIVQLVLLTIVYIVNAFVAMPIWIVVVLECVLILMAIIHVTFGFFFKARTEQFRNNKPSTVFVDMLRANIQIAVTNNGNPDLEKPLQNLLEIAKGTDPVSNEMTNEVEQKLTAKVDELKEKIDANANTYELEELINGTKKLIEERAILCKTGKK